MGLLDGKVALVTGGTSGIGRASAILFAREGAKVALTGRRNAEGEAVVAEIVAAGGDAFFIAADLARVGEIQTMVEKVVSRYGRLDCAFNNAGISGVAPLESIDEEAWDNLLDTNAKAAFFCLQAEAAQMKRNGGGAIVFNASVLAHISLPGTTMYGASKGALITLARAAAVELGPFGIRVNSISPSVTKTPMTTAFMESNGIGHEALTTGIPLGRLAEPEEMAKAALFLLSDLSSYVNGHALIVDGGQSVHG